MTIAIADTIVLPHQRVAEAVQCSGTVVRCDVIGSPATLQRGARGWASNDVTQQSAQNVNKSPGVATSYIRPCGQRSSGSVGRDSDGTWMLLPIRIGNMRYEETDVR